jgi:hypothetical protein
MWKKVIFRYRIIIFKTVKNILSESEPLYDTNTLKYTTGYQLFCSKQAKRSVKMETAYFS